MKPKVSVILSVYNSEQYLKEAIDSILLQTYTNFEFLIINDCSTDNTQQILLKFHSKDDRIKIINNHQNHGLTKNLNTLIKLSKGKYIARMDADDISDSQRLEKQVDFLENNQDVDILGTYSHNIDEEGKIIGNRKVPIKHEQIMSLLPILNPMSHPTVMFRKSAIERIYGYDERFKTSQDYYLWFKAAGASLRFHNIPEYLFFYRMNDQYIYRKSLRYRWNEFLIKIHGYRLINYPFFKYYYAIISLILAFFPKVVFMTAKKFDPRSI